MMADAMVFIHGGQHDARCWDPTLLALRERSSTPLLAVNLPGRNGEAGDLSTLSIAECVNSMLKQIREAKLQGKLMLVGHSMAGISMPALAAELNEANLHSMVFISCCIPKEGRSVVESLDPPMAPIAKFAAKYLKTLPPLPKAFASWVFGNGMTNQQKRFLATTLCRETTRITREQVSRTNMPHCPRHWILLERDRAISPSRQREFINNLGGVSSVESVDCCHDVMIAKPELLADSLLRISNA
ncbi:alpha/beta fold hydrolase [Zhongshania marina]|jgi:pimeloyl-ACP methyl ester carboxylesterase|uniref:Alpha/beta hydrolase n=1 Tax=Zhongshania marina TaxID=2304603 RepID=A0ABX9W3U3_9GAMM|nr:alpha/beta hydrolase [Zhongshania marina]